MGRNVPGRRGRGGKTRRPYHAPRREAAADERRRQVIERACELLDAPDGEPFSIDAVARRAGVSRMTVYNQFGSKAKLLEALFDALSVRGEFHRLPAIMGQRNPWKALDEVIELFARFWARNRAAHRRLGAAAVDDPELAAGLAARNERRLRVFTAIARRIRERQRRGGHAPFEETVRALMMLTSFETFDGLAGTEGSPEDVAPMVRRLARAVFAGGRG